VEPPTAPSRLTGRAGLAALVAVSVLALVETAVALVAPLRAPTEDDWRAAAREVRAGFQPGDLIVAAPAWADPILRVHLGDLIPAEVAGRLDDERFGRVWEVSQRGARASAASRGGVAAERRFGALTVRRIERPPAAVSYDFVAQWMDAHLSRRTAGGAVIDCPRAGDRLQCPDITYNFVRRQIVEVDTRLRMALLAQPVGQATVVLEYPAARLGRSLVVATGLSNVWMRKEAHGTVNLRVVIDGAADATFTTGNDDGWAVHRIDTSARAGQVAAVRFEITSPAPYARHFALAAEARE
jgi:hypothetical protein